MVRLLLLIPLITLTFACGAIFSNPTVSRCNYTSAPFGGGSGTLSDPYTICTVSHLMQVQNYLSSSFKQYADLDLAGNTTFTPIGSTATPFTGNYDGNGRKISNWTCGDPPTDNMGFFGVVSGSAAISNLNLVNFSITSSSATSPSNIGLLIGKTDSNSTSSLLISNVTTSGQISVSSGTSLGGLVGWMFQGTISKSSSSATVAGFTKCGGLIGYGSNGFTISNSFSTGDISGISQLIGGLVGQAVGPPYSSITSSYARGNITSQAGAVGGLVGWGAYVNLDRCYANGNSTGASSNVGGLIGVAVNFSISNSYSAGSIKGPGLLGGLTGLTRAGTISSSYSTSSISGTSASTYYGGLSARFEDNLGSVSISNSYATGTINAPGGSQVGGLVGASIGATATISNSYSLGAPTGSTFVGGLVGRCTSCGSITNSYWDQNTSGLSSSAGGTGYTTSQMQTQSNFSGWDFTTIWNPPSAGTYPTLR